MEKEFRKLSLRPSKIDLSTIHENDISRENLKLLHKQQLLAKYIDKEARENTDDFDCEEFDFSTTDGDQQAMDFDRIVRDKVESQNREKTFKVSPNRLKSAMKTPTSNHFLTLNKDFKSPRIDSISSSSSKTPSSINSYSESDTENSDYMADFDEFQDPEPEIDLIKNFNRRQMEAKRAAELARLENLAKYKKMKNNVLHNNNRLSKYYDKVDNDFIDDFSKDKAFESVEIDTSKLDRFKSNTPAFSALERKSSLPAIKMGMATGLEGSPRKIHRFSSTMDINNNTYNQKTFTPADTLRVASELKAFNGKELDNIDDFDLTITYSDYKKLKRKSQKFDLSKYTEPTSHRNHNHHHSSKQQNSDQKLIHLTPQNVSQTAKLTKEGKLKLIRSLGRPKVRKVMPGHMYGEIVYDPQLKKWMGNEEDAEKFESITSSKPKLINNNSMPQVVGNMIYDDKKLRWISMTGNYEDDPFDEDFDTTIKLTEKKASTKIGKGTGGSAFGRLVPSESTISISENLKNPNNHFRVHPDMYKSWKNEEERWVRKVGNWFPNDEHAHEFKYDLKIFLNQQ